MRRRSYDELAALVEGLVVRVDALEAENVGLRAEIAALRRKLGVDSTNSSTPPSKDSLAAQGKRKAQRSQRVRSQERRPGGQPGRKGSGLVPEVKPDRAETVTLPRECSGCGQDLAGGREVSSSWAQVWDIRVFEVSRALLDVGRCGWLRSVIVGVGWWGCGSRRRCGLQV